MRRAMPALAVLAGVVGTLAADRGEPQYRLFAHRGGVVEELFPDNSPGAFQAAVARGYWGLEVDIRESKDGVLVMQHDPDLRLNFNDARKVEELTWAELRELRSTVGHQPIWCFEDVVAAARAAGLRLMLDSKDPHGPEFCANIERVLREHAMLERCYIIGTADALAHFVGKAPVGLKARPLRAKLEADPSLAPHYFLFDEGSTTEDTVRWAQSLGLEVVPSINIQHYYDPSTVTAKSRDELAPLAAAKRDVDKFQALGVTAFQIDSEFDGWFDLPSSSPSP